ncbi:MAG: SDR family oxidoreductase [Sedimentisphaerales bacterium]|nr:SDR family oxidoreductase [Sedimentisphaerales bacterium]
MATQSDNLAGRTALITGAAHRLGRTIALALAEQGVNVIVHFNTSSTDAEALVDALRHKGVRAWSLRADLTEPGTPEALFSEACALAGPIEILINNASIFTSDTIQSLTEEALWYNVRIHALAPLQLARVFAAYKEASQIINFLDCRIVDYDSKHASYHLSKRMLFSLTRMLAMELAPQIRVNAIAPGLILPPKGKDETYLQELAHTNPLRRHGNPTDIINAVLFLLNASFITGQVIFVDGGRHMRGTMYG